MAKKIIVPLLMTGLISLLIFSCKKSDPESETKKSATQSLAHNAKLISKIIDMGVKIQVNFQDGCYHLKEHYYPNGNIETREIWCEGACSFCKLEGVTKVGFTVNTDGNKGIPVPPSEKSNSFYGMVGTASDGSGLVFAVDRTKISDAAYARFFSNDNVIVDNGYVLDDKAYNMLGITRNQQIIPAGTYPLHQDEDLIWWFVPNNR